MAEKSIEEKAEKVAKFSGGFYKGSFSHDKIDYLIFYYKSVSARTMFLLADIFNIPLYNIIASTIPIKEDTKGDMILVSIKFSDYDNIMLSQEEEVHNFKKSLG